MSSLCLSRFSLHHFEAIKLGVRILLFSKHVFADVPLILLADVPALGPHIVEGDVFAGVGFVAAHDDGEEDAVGDGDVFEFDVGDVDAGLGGAGAAGVEGVQHAARSAPVGLLLLLRAQVDSPPDGFVHGDVLVEDVVDESVPVVSGVGLDVYPLERFLHVGVAEGDVSDAVDVRVRRHAADGEPHAQSDGQVFDQEVLGAVGEVSRSVVCWFWDDHVVVVLAGDVEDVEVAAAGVDAVGVEREQGDGADQEVALEDVQLGCRVHSDIQVVNLGVDCLVEFYVVEGRVLQSEVVNGQIAHEIGLDEVGSSIAGGQVFLVDDPGVQPPDVASAIDFASAVDGYVVAVGDGDEVLVVGGLGGA